MSVFVRILAFLFLVLLNGKEAVAFAGHFAVHLPFAVDDAHGAVDLNHFGPRDELIPRHDRFAEPHLVDLPEHSDLAAVSGG